MGSEIDVFGIIPYLLGGVSLSSIVIGYHVVKTKVEFLQNQREEDKKECDSRLTALETDSRKSDAELYNKIDSSRNENRELVANMSLRFEDVVDRIHNVDKTVGVELSKLGAKLDVIISNGSGK